MQSNGVTQRLLQRCPAWLRTVTGGVYPVHNHQTLMVHAKCTNLNDEGRELQLSPSLKAEGRRFDPAPDHSSRPANLSFDLRRRYLAPDQDNGDEDQRQ